MNRLILFACLILGYITTFAQTKNDSTINRLPDNTELLNVESPKDHSPTRAALLSMAFPGLGQIYNASSYKLGKKEKKIKKILRYGKLPILYGLGGLFVTNIVLSHREYILYQSTLYNRQKPNYGGVDDFTNLLTDEELRNRKDSFKAFRDDNIIYLILLYTANVLDANVEAHLIDFKISESLIMTAQPTLIMSTGAFASNSNTALGVSLKFNIK